MQYYYNIIKSLYYTQIITLYSISLSFFSTEKGDAQYNKCLWPGVQQRIYIPTLSLSTLKHCELEKKITISIIAWYRIITKFIIIICEPYSSASRTFFWLPLSHANNNIIIMILHDIIITAHGGNKSVFTILSACVQVCVSIFIF